MNPWRVAFAIPALAILGHTVSAQGILLRQQHPAGDTPAAIAAGDVDGDGATDLVAANTGDGTVSVLLGDRAGALAPQVTYPTGSGLHALALADLDGDGNLDIGAVDNLSAAVLLNQGNGTFGPATRYPAGLDVVDLAIGDVNGDGKPDLAVISGTLALLINQGDGTFASAVNVPVAGGLVDVALGDVDADGDADIAIGNSGQASISVLLNDGAGNLAAPVAHAVAASIATVTIADVNTDGMGDLIAANTSASVSVLLSLGNGSFAPETVHPTLPSPDSLAVGNVNSDQVPDIVVGHGAGDAIAVLINQGNGNFAPRTDGPAGSSPASLVLTDFNDDGANDVALAHREIDRISVLINDGVGSFLPPSHTLNGLPGQPVMEDLNADGAIDIVVPLDTSLAVLLNDGQGSFTETPYPVAGFPFAVTIADMNNDRRPDLLAIDGFAVAVLLNEGNGSFGAPTRTFLFGNYVSLLAIDLNGDNEPDLALPTFSKTGVGWLTVLLNQGDGTFGPQRQYGLTGFPREEAHGDFNGDGDIDIVMAGVLFHNAGDGTFAVQSAIGAGSATSAVIAGDLNHDSNLDLVAANANARTIIVFRNDGDANFTKSTYPVPVRAWNLHVADLNGDARLDVAMSNLDDDAMSVLFNIGEGTLGQFQQFGSAGGSLPQIATGDIDLDGSRDIVAAHYQDQQLRFLINQLEAPCQPDLGFQGPGTATAALCGPGLLAGEVSSYQVNGAATNAPGAVLVSLPWQPNITLFPSTNPGTLLSGVGLVFAAPINADANGELAIPVSGIAAVTDLVLQSLFLDAAVPPHNLALTNAVLARFGT